MKILTKYVLREHLAPLMFALCALTSLLLLNYIAKQLPHLAGKGLPWKVVAEFLLLSIPFTVAMTLPMAVLVAVLYAFSRLAAENEVPAMKANGIAMGSLLLPVAVCSVLAAVVMVLFNDQILPRANHRLATLQRDIALKKPTFALKEQVLNDVLPSKGLNIRADVIDRGTDMLRNVHIYDMTNGEAIRTIHADSGSVALTTDQRDLILTLYNGYLIDIDRANPSTVNRVYFVSNRMRVEGVGNELRRIEQGDSKGEREQSVCEMDQKYQVAYRVNKAARAELRDYMLRIVRNAVAGDGSMIMGDFPATDAARTWGSTYCAGVKALAKHVPFLSTGLPDSLVAEDPLLPSRKGGLLPGGILPGRVPQGGNLRSSTPDAAPAQLTPGAQSGAFSTSAFDPNSFGAQDPQSLGERITSNIVTADQSIELSNSTMNRFAVEIHKKFSLAGACVVFVLIGVPFALRFPRGGVGLVIGMSLVIFAISYVGLIAGEGLAKGGKMSPFIAMWWANFLLAVVGAALLLQMGKESATRGSSLAALRDEIREWFSRFRRGRRS